MTNAYAQYQNNSIMTASPAELTLMLYNGAIKLCNQAIEAMEKGDIQNSHTYCIKAQNIISELRATLDKKYEVAQSMGELYDFIYDSLVEGNIHKDVQKIQDALSIIREFRDMWQQIMKQPRR